MYNHHLIFEKLN